MGETPEDAERYDRGRCYYGDRGCPCMLADPTEDRCTRCGSGEWDEEETDICLGCEARGTRMSAVLALWPVIDCAFQSDGDWACGCYWCDSQRGPCPSCGGPMAACGGLSTWSDDDRCSVTEESPHG